MPLLSIFTLIPPDNCDEMVSFGKSSDAVDMNFFSIFEEKFSIFGDGISFSILDDGFFW